jgi:N-dimethylarginine dimethylaminohydrolase
MSSELETPNTERAFGLTDMTGTLRRVLVRPPSADSAAVWKTFGWRREPDTARLAEEHEAFCALLEEAGAEVVLAQTPLAISPDAIYVYDPALITADGALLLRPGKPGRRDEVSAMAADLVEAGVPIAGALEGPATVEGGDTVWLDERTLLVGRGYRTNDAGIHALAAALPDVDVIAYDLPHLNGAGEVLHLMSLISPLDEDLAVVYLPLMPVRLVELLAARGIELVDVPEAEFWTMGPNVLALGPRRALALDGNPVTREHMEAAGVEVTVYTGEELSKLGDGGPTCLTRPLLRT